MYCCAPAPSRTAPFVVAAAQGGKHEDGREIVRPFDDCRSLGPYPGRSRSRRAGRGDRRDRPGSGRSGPAQGPEPQERQGLRHRRAGRPRQWPPHAIRFSLHCDNDHDFDGWFSERRGFRHAEESAGWWACPTCHSSKVEKALMAPAVSTARKAEKVALVANEAPAPDDGGAMMKDVAEKVRQNADYVGDKFAEEAAQDPFRRGPKTRAASMARRRWTKPASWPRTGSSSCRCPSCRTTGTDRPDGGQSPLGDGNPDVRSLLGQQHVIHIHVA